MPPADDNAEQAALGSCVLTLAAIEAVFTHVTPSDFYNPRHQAIAEAIHSLWSKGEPVDAVTVSGWLVGRGHENDHRDVGAYLMELAGNVPSTQRAGAYAVVIADKARRRRLIMHLADASSDLFNIGLPTEAIMAGLFAAANNDPGAIDDWLPILLDAELPEPAEPALLARTDGRFLLYPGRIHALVGEPESGKSWMAAFALAHITAQGGLGTVLDFEGQAADWQSRIASLAIPGADLNRIRYVRPNGPLSNPRRLTELCEGSDLTVFDGVTDAYAMHGLDPYDNLDAARFITTYVLPVIVTGSAALLLDHVVKNREDRGRWAIGAQHKLAGIDVQYMIDVLQPFGIGRTGSARLTVNKDRPGAIRGFAEGGKSVGTFTVSSYPDGGTVAKIEPPRATDDSGPSFRPTALMAKVSYFLASQPDITFTSNGLRAAVKGNNAARELALDLLVGEGFVKRHTKGSAKTYQHIRAFTPPINGTHPST